MSDWLTEVATLTDTGQSCILVTVIATRGSIPREAGTRMVITAQHCHGTIGGGHLEFVAIDMARQQLSDAEKSDVFTHRFPLGASLGQCCGGLVYLLFERLQTPLPAWLDFVHRQEQQKQVVCLLTQLLPDSKDTGIISSVNRLAVSEQGTVGKLDVVHDIAIHYARQKLAGSRENTAELIDAAILQQANAHEYERSGSALKPVARALPLLAETRVPDPFTIYLFGAGHVGQAIVTVLSGLPCKIHWIDSRDDQFPALLPSNVEPHVSDQPAREVDDISAGSHVLIMTHSHALDEAICERALRRSDLVYCGLIGSASKRANFIRRFESRGLSADSIAGLTCPIGLDALPGKHPSEIAIAVAAQLLLLRTENKRTSAQTAPCSRPLAESASTRQAAFASA